MSCAPQGFAPGQGMPPADAACISLLRSMNAPIDLRFGRTKELLQGRRAITPAAGRRSEAVEILRMSLRPATCDLQPATHKLRFRLLNLPNHHRSPNPGVVPNRGAEPGFGCGFTRDKLPGPRSRVPHGTDRLIGPEQKILDSPGKMRRNTTRRSK